MMQKATPENKSLVPSVENKEATSGRYSSPEEAGLSLRRSSKTDRNADEFVATKDVTVSTPDGRQIVAAHKGMTYTRKELARYGVGSVPHDPDWRL